jgi:hypothetical protein
LAYDRRQDSGEVIKKAVELSPAQYGGAIPSVVTNGAEHPCSLPSIDILTSKGHKAKEEGI